MPKDGEEELKGKVEKTGDGKFKHSYVPESETLFEFITDFRMRNYQTILSNKDKYTHCSCGEKLLLRIVKFRQSEIKRKIRMLIQFCPKCDDVPSKSSIILARANNKTLFL